MRPQPVIPIGCWVREIGPPGHPSTAVPAIWPVMVQATDGMLSIAGEAILLTSNRWTTMRATSLSFGWGVSYLPPSATSVVARGLTRDWPTEHGAASAARASKRYRMAHAPLAGAQGGDVTARICGRADWDERRSRGDLVIKSWLVDTRSANLGYRVDLPSPTLESGG